MSSSEPVHPHARGDIFLFRQLAVFTGGTPPRTWGHCNDGQGQPCLISVHPHARGDIQTSASVVAIPLGTPPRTWGHSDAGSLWRGRNRYTPTHVGTFASKQAEDELMAVHPHARGDIGCRPSPKASVAGTPPRTWGHYGERSWHYTTDRYTPTHVGTLLLGLVLRTVPSVHPHARGDILHSHAHSSLRLGTPPRTWGHSHLTIPKRVLARYTPTHVGTFSRCLPVMPSPPVHPHARGDIVLASATLPYLAGTPPRTWGHFSHRTHEDS